MENLTQEDLAVVKLAAAHRYAELGIRPETADYLMGRYLTKESKCSKGHGKKMTKKPAKKASKKVAKKAQDAGLAASAAKRLANKPAPALVQKALGSGAGRAAEMSKKLNKAAPATAKDQKPAVKAPEPKSTSKEAGANKMAKITKLAESLKKVVKSDD